MNAVRLVQKSVAYLYCGSLTGLPATLDSSKLVVEVYILLVRCTGFEGKVDLEESDRSIMCKVFMLELVRYNKFVKREAQMVTAKLSSMRIVRTGTLPCLGMMGLKPSSGTPRSARKVTVTMKLQRMP